MLMKLEFSRHILKKYANIKVIKILSEGAELFHAVERTDRHDKADSHFSQFCVKRLKMLKDKDAPVSCGMRRRVKIMFRNAWLHILPLSINFHTLL
jgi:hypothetical protein